LSLIYIFLLRGTSSSWRNQLLRFSRQVCRLCFLRTNLALVGSSQTRHWIKYQHQPWRNRSVL